MVESSREAASKAAAAMAAAAKAKAKTSYSIPTVIAKPATSYSIPSVIAKPAAQVAPTAAPKATTGGYSGIPTTAAKAPVVTPVKTVTPAAKTNTQMAADSQAILDKLAGISTRVDALGGSTVGGVSSSGTQLRPTTRTPVYGANGKIVGYNVTKYNLDGSIASVDFEADTSSQAEEAVLGTTNIQVLKSMLIATGLPASLVEGSTTFLQSLLKDGLTESAAVDIYLNNKEFTTKSGSVLTSPFYSTYGFYNEKSSTKYSASDLFNTVEGYKTTQTKYNLNQKFVSQDYIQKYLNNKMSVAKFDENANRARLAAINADPLVVGNLQQLGYIGTNADLTDFYMDPNVGMEKMQQNFNTAALSYEAVRRSNTGITFNKANFEKLGAELTAQGYNEEQSKYRAGQVYNTIGQELRPTVGVSNIYEGTGAGTAATIQSELEQQEFNNIESLRIKKLKELEARSFQAQSGRYTGKTTVGNNYSTAGQI